MKTNLIIIIIIIARSVFGQNTVIYDQVTVGSQEGAASVKPGNGQSFTPSLSAVSVFQLAIYDLVAGGNGGGTVRVDIRADSLTGTLLGSTTPVTLPNLFGGQVDFFFLDPVALVPGNTYYFQPVTVTGSGFGWGLMNFAFPYSGGTAFFNGVADPLSDFWFREGILGVPEPSTVWLVLVGVGGLAFARRINRDTNLSS